MVYGQIAVESLRNNRYNLTFFINKIRVKIQKKKIKKFITLKISFSKKLKKKTIKIMQCLR
jgi:hypothetical protein